MHNVLETWSWEKVHVCRASLKGARKDGSSKKLMMSWQNWEKAAADMKGWHSGSMKWNPSLLPKLKNNSLSILKYHPHETDEATNEHCRQTKSTCSSSTGILSFSSSLLRGDYSFQPSIVGRAEANCHFQRTFFLTTMLFSLVVPLKSCSYSVLAGDFSSVALKSLIRGSQRRRCRMRRMEEKKP